MQLQLHRRGAIDRVKLFMVAKKEAAQEAALFHLRIDIHILQPLSSVVTPRL